MTCYDLNQWFVDDQTLGPNTELEFVTYTLLLNEFELMKLLGAVLKILVLLWKH